MKQAILGILRDQQGLDIQGQQFKIFADLSATTISKSKNLKFLTQVLIQHTIQYRWGFPFKPIGSHDKQRILIRDPQEGHFFIYIGLRIVD